MQAKVGKFTCQLVSHQLATCQRATSREACGTEKLLAGARGEGLAAAKIACGAQEEEAYISFLSLIKEFY